MLSPRVLQYAAIALAVGHFAHVFYFVRGEHHKQGPRYLFLVAISPFLVFASVYRFARRDLAEAGLASLLLPFSFLTGLFTSILLYRLFFHPLRRFPGPIGFRISKLWHASQLRGHDNYKLLDSLYHKYGSFVRTGPNELMVLTPDALVSMVGPGSKCTKGAWYDQNLPLVSLHRARNKADHDRRRKIWDKAFNMKSLRDYYPRISGYTDQLITQLTGFSGKPVDAARWMNFYSFDVMGDLAFGRPFGLLENGETHWVLELLHQGMVPVGILSPVPWIFPLLKTIPRAGASLKKFFDWCYQRIEERKKMTVERRDVASYLLDASEKAQDTEEDKLWLQGDARLIVVAGSDTTSTTLTHIIYHLCDDPSQIDKIRDEVEPLLAETGKVSLEDLQRLPHLNGVINEALRLHPPVPSGVFRMTPPEGITIGGQSIPGSVNLLCPMWTVSRLESCFAYPNEFIPERWYSRPELVKAKEAFAPFSLGPYSCIGKPLALMELREVISRLVTRFDIKFGPNENGDKLLNESMDLFTISTAPLRVSFEVRR